ncbi:MAG: HAD family phosphatase [Mucinivorans sp.]
MKKLKNPNFRDVKNIIFDFGGVLLDIDIQLSLNAFAKLGLTGLERSSIHPNNRGIFLESEIGAISDSEFFDSLSGMFTCSSAQPSREELEKAWCALLLPFNWANFELLDSLRVSGYKLFLLSNTNSPHHLCFERNFAMTNPWGRTFDSFFDRVFYSDVLCLRKPGREIYQRVLDITSIEPTETLFIDDNEPNLVEPALLGLHVHHLIPSQTVHELFVE